MSIRCNQRALADTAAILGRHGIYVWQSNHYALNLTERLGIEAQAGLLRIGLVHYDTHAEVERFLQALSAIIA